MTDRHRALLCPRHSPRQYFVHRSPGPVEKPARAGTNGILANGAHETFIGLPVLPEEPVQLGISYGINEMHERAGHHPQQGEEKDVFEVT